MGTSALILAPTLVPVMGVGKWSAPARIRSLSRRTVPTLRSGSTPSLTLLCSSSSRHSCYRPIHPSRSPNYQSNQHIGSSYQRTRSELVGRFLSLRHMDQDRKKVRSALSLDQKTRRVQLHRSSSLSAPSLRSPTRLIDLPRGAAPTRVRTKVRRIDVSRKQIGSGTVTVIVDLATPHQTRPVRIRRCCYEPSHPFRLRRCANPCSQIAGTGIAGEDRNSYQNSGNGGGKYEKQRSQSSHDTQI